jgi:hypothetical protein
VVSLGRFEIESSGTIRVTESGIYLFRGAHVMIVPGRHPHHLRAVQDCGRCCRWNRARCTWDSKRKIGKTCRTEETDRPLVVQRAIWYIQPAKECPDVRIVPVDDRVNAHKRWPVRIGMHAEVECCCAPMSKNGWQKTTCCAHLHVDQFSAYR